MRRGTHRRELVRLLTFLVVALLLEGALYLYPGQQEWLPWLPDEPVPLVRLLPTPAPEAAPAPRIEVVRLTWPRPVTPVPVSSWLPEPPSPVTAGELPQRSIATPTPLEIPEGALNSFFLALAATETGVAGHLTRVLHWGDSTIAGDGITGTVRGRLSDRFGSAGPGFLAAHTDPVWSLLPGVVRQSEGEWQSLTIISTGIEEQRRCGLAGTAATAAETSYAVLGGFKEGRNRQLLSMVDIFFRAQPDGGTFTIWFDDQEILSLTTAADSEHDRFHRMTVPKGLRQLRLETNGDGPVTLYGAALETIGPGITWETFGIAGASVWNILRQEESHFIEQIARRRPSLLVLQTGGNELGHPGVTRDEGRRYRRAARILLRRIRAAAPEASCLVIGPLDQARRERGQVISEPLLDRVISIQRQVAAEHGCVFWDARQVMGNDGGFARWLEHSPSLAWTDLKHLTNRGLDLVGNCLADALLAAYDRWLEANPDVAWHLPPPEPVPELTAAAAQTSPQDQAVAELRLDPVPPTALKGHGVKQ
jgi:lysophospholipase L1-like esterase